MDGYGKFYKNEKLVNEGYWNEDEYIGKKQKDTKDLKEIVPKNPKVFVYDFTTQPTPPGLWEVYSNKLSSSEFKNGKWIVSMKQPYKNLKNKWEQYFLTDYNSGDATINAEFVGSFNNVQSVDSAYYGYLCSVKCKETNLYYHVGFIFNKKNYTFSIFEFEIHGNQTTDEGQKHYIITDQKTNVQRKPGEDILGIKRFDGKWFFSINSEIVYTMGDIQSQCPWSIAPSIIIKNKIQLEIDDMIFNYNPNKESKYFKPTAVVR